MSENTQEPKRECRGVWIPVEVCQLVMDGEITAHQAFLAATIDSLVSRDKGCYASNEYLAQCTGSTPKSVSNAISHLKKKGLVFQTGFDGRTRHLAVRGGASLSGPPELLDVVRDGYIGRGAAILAMVIAGIANNHGNKYRACAATNRQLGDEMNLKPRQIQNLLHELMEAGVVKEVQPESDPDNTHHQRYLVTFWNWNWTGPTKKQGGSR